MLFYMAESEGSRRESLMLEAVDPADGTRSRQVQVSHRRLRAVATRSQGHAKELAYIVPMILRLPTAIFEGLRRDEDEDRWGYGWRCYCGKPDQSFRADGAEAPPYPDQVYLVFVNDQGVAYNWRWEKAARDNPDLPQNHEARFRRRLL